jgi:hypothetical protein
MINTKVTALSSLLSEQVSQIRKLLSIKLRHVAKAQGGGGVLPDCSPLSNEKFWVPRSLPIQLYNLETIQRISINFSIYVLSKNSLVFFFCVLSRSLNIA